MKKLRLVSFLLRDSRGAMALMICAGVLSGFSSVGVIAVISRALHPDGLSPAALIGAFVLLVAAKVATGVASQLLLTRFSQGTILDLSLSLCNRILRTPLRRLEREGSGRILTVLTDDVSAVTWAVQCVPTLATNVAVVMGCGVYLAWLSWQMFLWAALITAGGSLIYKILNDRSFSHIFAARDARARLLNHFETLISGIKELMMHRARRNDFVGGDLRPAADAYRRSNLEASARHALAGAWVQTLLYSLIGVLLFAYPAITAPPTETLIAYVFAILYMMTPLWTIIGAVPSVMRGQVALQRIEDLGISLGPEAPDTRDTSDDKNVVPAHRIELLGLRFNYERTADGRDGFAVGPINFSLGAGELVFVVGGNGSGKSTFAKLLVGLYQPQQGVICVDGVPVAANGQEQYRENFSAVFSDFHLFGKLLGLSAPDLSAATHQYLELLEIDRKVSLQGQSFSTTELSQGQRKRLALVTAYLEDRPFYIFDEWAADQDPEYKNVFYSKLLPDLRNRGKGVVVITHDDRYFHTGDRVIRLEDGRIVDPVAVAQAQAARLSPEATSFNRSSV